MMLSYYFLVLLCIIIFVNFIIFLINKCLKLKHYRFTTAFYYILSLLIIFIISIFIGKYFISISL